MAACSLAYEPTRNARTGDPLSVQFFRCDARLVVVIPEDRAFAGELLDDNHRALRLRADGDHHIRAIHALFLQRLDLHPAFVVIANFADVASLQAKPLRADHRGRDLSAGHLLMIGQPDFGIEMRKARDRD